MTIPNLIKHPVLPAVMLTLAAAACSSDPQDASQPPASPVSSNLGPGQAAIVNDRVVPESVFRLHVLNVTQQSAEDLSDEDRMTLLDDLIDYVLVAQEAEEQGLLNERTVAANLELQRLQLLANLMAQRYVDRNPATEEEMLAIYNENLPNLISTEYRVRHILVSTEQLAEALISELDAGANFTDLADEHSLDESDLGWFTLDAADPTFAAGIRMLQVGEHSHAPVQTQFGWHVILLEDSRELDPPEMDAVRNELRAAVDRQRVARFLDELRERSSVEVLID
jgi:peptidyl-prolyl cis-trans isomerase C